VKGNLSNARTLVEQVLESTYCSRAL